MADRRSCVCVVGAGPAGLALAHLLHQAKVPFVVLERQQRDELRALTKAGLIEQRVVAALKPYGLADVIINRGSRNGIAEFRSDGEVFVVDYGRLTNDGQGHFVYPQHELVADWAEALVARGGEICFGTRVVQVEQNATGVEVRAVVEPNEAPLAIRSDFVVACDGAGSIVARAAEVATFAVTHPFRWLAVIAAVAPPTPRSVYGLHRRGFAGQFRRSANSTRYYLEVPGRDTTADWPDDRVWNEIEERMAAPGQPRLVRGDLIEWDFLDLRVRVREPMQSGRIFLAGDAAHMVTPAGGKGMNMAILDVIEVAGGLCEHYGKAGTDDRLAAYSRTRLPEIWRYEEFSNWMLSLLHAGAAFAEYAASAKDRVANGADFAYRLRRGRLDRMIADPLFARWFARTWAGAC